MDSGLQVGDIVRYEVLQVLCAIIQSKDSQVNIFDIRDCLNLAEGYIKALDRREFEWLGLQKKDNTSNPEGTEGESPYHD